VGCGLWAVGLRLWWVRCGLCIGGAGVLESGEVGVLESGEVGVLESGEVGIRRCEQRRDGP